jgi:polyferredoxin
MAKKKSSLPVTLRRLVQTAFLLLFLILFLETAFHPSNKAGGYLTFFFDLDPLALIVVWLGGHAAATALLFSLITLAVTFVFGRWFCGWICPFGAIHNLFSSWRGGSHKQKVVTGGYSLWQTSKYYVLGAVLIAALCGTNIAGWFDPFSFLYRSMATAVFPAIDGAMEGFFGWINQLSPGFAGAVTEPVYRALHYYLMTVSQPHFFWSMVTGSLFGLVVLLNLFRARFWCKYICPLGALLGVAGKNPLLRLVVDPSSCKNCKECVTECQGGANPNGPGNWKPSECMYCWNCDKSCPSNSLSFKFMIPSSQLATAPKKEQELVGVQSDE